MTMPVVSTDAGEIADELSTITAAELCQLRLSRAAPSVCRKGEVDAGVQNPAIGSGRSRPKPWNNHLGAAICGVCSPIFAE